MINNLIESCGKHIKNIMNLTSVECMIMDTCEKKLIPLEESRPCFCTHCNLRDNRVNLHLYGSNEAYRWNGKYIYYCPKGLAFIAVSLSDETGNMIGSIISGPMIIECDENDYLDYFDDQMDNKMKEDFYILPRLAASKVTSLSEVLYMAAEFISGIPSSKAGTFVYEQEKLLNTIYNINSIYAKQDKECSYPILYEKQLQKLIVTQDKKGAQKLFNDLLAHIFLSCDFDLDTIKVRVIELIVLLSRATIDAGANVNEIFCFNYNYIKKIEQFRDIEDLSVWLTGIMHRFISYSFDFTKVKHSDIVYKVMQYIKSNYTKKLSLEEIAKHVYISSSYLSTIFKEETGQSLTSYINNFRIEKSKMLMLQDDLPLVDIANLCGLNDQSYFTKVFKRVTGLSPKAYRESRGNLINNIASNKLVGY